MRVLFVIIMLAPVVFYWIDLCRLVSEKMGGHDWEWKNLIYANGQTNLWFAITLLLNVVGLILYFTIGKEKISKLLEIDAKSYKETQERIAKAAALTRATAHVSRPPDKWDAWNAYLRSLDNQIVARMSPTQIDSMREQFFRDWEAEH